MGVEADAELGKLMSTMVRDELISRWAVVTGGFQYALATKGRERLKAEGESPPPLVSTPPPVEVPVSRTVELAETARISKGDVAKVKAFLTQQATTFRPPYGKAVPPKTTAPAPTPAEKELVMPKSDNASNAARVLEAIVQKKGITTKQLQELLGLDAKAVGNVVYQLKRNGKIDRARIAGDGTPYGWSIAHGDAQRAGAAKSGLKKANAKKKAPKKLRAVKARPTSRKRASASRVPAATPANKDAVLATAANSEDLTVASFTKRGEILVSGRGARKILDVAESREVIELVRHFDKAGLLPEAA
jgi:hypothetical protein